MPTRTEVRKHKLHWTVWLLIAVVVAIVVLVWLASDTLVPATK